LIRSTTAGKYKICGIECTFAKKDYGERISFSIKDLRERMFFSIFAFDFQSNKYGKDF